MRARAGARRLLARFFAPLFLTSTVALSVGGLAIPAAAAVDTGATAAQIAAAINANVDVTGASFAVIPPAGTPNAVVDSALASFPTDGSTFGILTSGNAAFADDTPQSFFASAGNGGGNVRGNTDFDVDILKVDFNVPEPPVGDVACLLVDFRFLSEEFPEFVGSSFNDAFIAELDVSDWTTSGSTISAPSNFAFGPDGPDAGTDPDPITINTVGAFQMTAEEAAGTAYDGATPVLVAQTPVSGGAHSVYFSIFDQGDAGYDSAVFLDALSIGTADSEGDCEPGAKPNLALTLTVGDGDTDTGATVVGMSDLPPVAVPGTADSLESAPLKTSPLKTSPLKTSPLKTSPLKTSPLKTSPLKTSPLKTSPLKTSPLKTSPLGTAPLSEFPLLRPGGWPLILSHTDDLQNATPQSVTWAELFNDDFATDTDPCTLPELSNDDTSGCPAPVPAPLAFADINLALSPIGDLSVMTLLMGDVSWDEITHDWCAEWAQPDAPESCGTPGVPTLDTTIFDSDMLGFAVEETTLGIRTIGQITVPAETMFWDLLLIDVSNVNGSFIGGVPIADIPEPYQSAIVNCSLVDCSAESTDTLSDAYDADAILSTATFGDLLTPLNDFTVTDVTLAFMDPSAVDWENIPLSIIPFEELDSPPTTFLPGTLTAEVPCADSAGMSVGINLPGGFRYRPGSAHVSVGAGEPAGLDDADSPSSDPERGLVWDLPDCTGDSAVYTVTFEVMPGFTTGEFTFDASVVSATTSAGLTDVSPVTVVDGFSGNDTLEGAASVSTNNMVFGHLSSPAYFEFSADPGKRLTVTLSHLSNDYDLVLYAPVGAQEAELLSANAPVEIPFLKAPVADPGALGGGAAPAPEAVQDIPLVPGRVVAGVSGFLGTEPEAVTTTAVTGTDGNYLVQVTSNNSDVGPQPFVLTIRSSDPTSLPSCETDRASAFSGGVAATGPVTITDPNTNTLVLVNQKRMQAAFGVADATAILTALSDPSNLTNDLNDVSGVNAEIVPVDAFGDVSAAFAAADADPCSPAVNNDVVREINEAVDSLKSEDNGQLANVKYLVIVGDDDIIPHARLADGTFDGNEAGFTGDTFFDEDTNQLGGAFGQSFYLSDAPFGSPQPVSILGQTIYPLQLGTGRLGGDAATILQTIDNFVASDGLADPDTASAGLSSGLETDYDFIRDGGALMHAEIAGLSGLSASTVERLTDELGPPLTSWTRADLEAVLFPASDEPPDVIAPNAHYDQYRLLPGQSDLDDTWTDSDLFDTGDLEDGAETKASTPGATDGLNLRVVFGIGCHMALDFPDRLAGASPSADDAARVFDWSQAYFKHGAAVMVGNLGYGYGDSATVALSERLYADFADNLSSSPTIGEALVLAQEDYLTSAGGISPYDIKSLQEAVMWGLPMYHLPGTAGPSVSASSLPLAGGSSGPSIQTVVADPVSGLDSSMVTVSPAFNRTTLPDGTQFDDADGLTQATHPYPIMPKVVEAIEAAEGGKIAKGAIMLGGTVEESSINIAFANATIDNGGEPAPASETSGYPTTPQSIGTFVNASGQFVQKLVVVPGLFRSDDNLTNSPSMGTMRRLSTSDWLVAYSADTTDFSPPVFSLVQAEPSGGNTTFEAHVSDEGGSVVRVVINALPTSGNTYQVIELAEGDPGVWTADVPGLFREFTAFALDSNANSGSATNRGAGYALTDSDNPSIEAEVGTPSVDVAGVTYVTSATDIMVSATDAGTGISSCTVEVVGPVNASHDCETPLTFQLPATDGKYVITITAKDFAQPKNVAELTLELVVDETGPTFTCTPPSGSTFGLNSGPQAVSATAQDDGVGFGAPPGPFSGSVDTSTPGPKGVFSATDALGNTTDPGCTYLVTYTFTGFTAPVNNPPDVNVATAGKNVPFKWRLTDAAGNPYTGLTAADVTLEAVPQSVGDCTGSVTDPIETYTNGTGFKNLGNGYYQFDWKSPKSFAGKCKALILLLNDGVVPDVGDPRTALFRFK